MINEWDLASTNLHRLSQRKYEVAVLPIGATEAHNRHLPEGQDFLLATYVARTACQMAWSKCESVICLPVIPYGADCNLMAFPLTIHVSQATLDTLVRDIITSLRHHGIRKIVIINGHGGNDFKPLIRQIQSDLDVFVFQCNWWLVGMDRYREIFTLPDEHAGEMEASVTMALFPELVEPNVAGDGRTPAWRFEALRRGWAQSSRDFSKLNDHCATADSSHATAEKGRAYLALCCERIATFLHELATTPIDEHFPYEPR
ncbi:MAG TPA: creatininase family protein [Phycisphaerae bacterium]|nr:creatininase family protein [Phycisphaerae bacterium]HOJ72971.1 creatininase family protein [Phycisphaerae bacterium]HOM50155.1 creatininase family protein [Phycisphaerae bacterium]HOQ84326.1 creatininase family protein [Phycisphaerae bacterium]HPZ97496.1 creatininase family protein [Phycisphaerae bacterium]